MKKHRRSFLRELLHWSDLPDHPQLASFRFFRTIGRDVLIFSEYVSGGSLKDWIRQGRTRNPAVILDIAIQTAWGLHIAHERGLIHQDVKPGNVLMTTRGVAKIADFGLARARAAAGEEPSRVVDLGDDPQDLATRPALTAHVSCGGMTPAFASPEQMTGKLLTRKTDLWSWGLTVLSMLNGGVTWLSGGAAQSVLEQFASSSEDTESGTPVTAGLLDVLSRCFEFNPDDRWDTLAGAASRLIKEYRHICGTPYPREFELPEDQGIPREGEHHVRDIVTTSPPWRDPGVLFARAVATDSSVAEADAGSLPGTPRSHRGQAIADLIVYEEIREICTGAAGRGSAAHQDLLAEAYRQQGHVYFHLGDLAAAAAIYRQTIQLLNRSADREQSTGKSSDLPPVLMDLAACLYTMGDMRGAISFYDQAIEIRERQVRVEGLTDQASNLARAYTCKAVALISIGEQEEAIDIYDEAINIFQRLVDEEGRSDLNRELAVVYTNKANALRDCGHSNRAIELYDQALKLRTRLAEVGGRSGSAIDLARLYLNKAIAMRQIGDYHEAIAMNRQAIKIISRLVVEEGRSELAENLAAVYMNTANALSDLDDRRGAIELYDQAIGIRERLVKMEGRSELASDLAIAYTNKALALSFFGDNPAAISLNDQAIAIFERLVNVEGRTELRCDLASARLHRALALYRGGEIRQATSEANATFSMLESEFNRSGRNDLD